MIRLSEDDRLCVDVVEPDQLLPVGRYYVKLIDAYVGGGIMVERLAVVEPVGYADKVMTLTTPQGSDLV